VASIIAAVLIFNEILTTQRVLGAGMVLLGIIIVQYLDYQSKRP
jgi:drug/metabolite transporter (DMT)-like permease